MPPSKCVVLCAVCGVRGALRVCVCHHSICGPVDGCRKQSGQVLVSRCVSLQSAPVPCAGVLIMYTEMQFRLQPPQDPTHSMSSDGGDGHGLLGSVAGAGAGAPPPPAAHQRPVTSPFPSASHADNELCSSVSHTGVTSGSHDLWATAKHGA